MTKTRFKPVPNTVSASARRTTEKSYPVDIAVFNSSKKTEDELFMVVECKKKERKDGEHQLRLYMDMSAAEVGVWFNGDEHIYLHKVHHKDGKRTYEP
jgi:type I restriction enzyme M protein